MTPLKKFLDWLRDPNQIKAQHKKNREYLNHAHSEYVDFKLNLQSSHPYRKFRAELRWPLEEGDQYGD